MSHFKVSYRKANQNRDRLYGCPDPDAMVDVSELADKVRLQSPLLLIDLIKSFAGASVPIYSLTYTQIKRERICSFDTEDAR